MSKLPKVVMVGRTNVGKSTLFNRLAQQVKSITLDQEGVTRDFLQDMVCWNDACFTLVDTGGLQLKDQQDVIYAHVSSKVVALTKEADLLLFVVDGSVGLRQQEFDIAKLLHKAGKSTLVVINKSDVRQTEDNQYEFDRFGFSSTIMVSAEHGLGVGDLLDRIVDMLPYKVSTIEVQRLLKVAIIGKPNVGKSSLLNALLRQDRMIVSDIPGTTREAITEKISFYKQNIDITDTPGVRKKRGVTDTIEKLMVKKSFQALKTADIILLVVDASAKELSDQELKLAFYAFEHHKALIVLFNKYDLMDDDIQEQLDFNLEPYNFFLKKIETMRISCKSGKNIGKLLAIVTDVADRYNQQFSTHELTLLFKEALVHRPLFHQGMRLIVYNAKQIKTAPITIVLYVNEPDWFGTSQLAYLDNVLRKEHKLIGVPIKFITRKN